MRLTPLAVDEQAAGQGARAEDAHGYDGYARPAQAAHLGPRAARLLRQLLSRYFDDSSCSILLPSSCLTDLAALLEALSILVETFFSTSSAAVWPAWLPITTPPTSPPTRPI